MCRFGEGTQEESWRSTLSVRLWGASRYVRRASSSLSGSPDAGDLPPPGGATPRFVCLPARGAWRVMGTAWSNPKTGPSHEGTKLTKVPRRIRGGPREDPSCSLRVLGAFVRVERVPASPVTRHGHQPDGTKVPLRFAAHDRSRRCACSWS